MPTHPLHMVICCLVLLAVFLAFAREWLPPALAALSGLALLLITGILDPNDLATVFGNSAALTIAAMFILGEAISENGVINSASALFAKVAGRSRVTALAVMAALVIPLSALMNNTPVVVVFLPVLLAYARHSGIKPTQLLIPLSFFSILGGTITLIGTSTNLLVADIAEKHGQTPFTLFEIAPFGLVCAVIGTAYLLLAGRFLLPERDTVTSTLPESASRNFYSAVAIPAGSPLIGKRLTSHPLFSHGSKTVVYDVLRFGRRLTDTPMDSIVLRANDILSFRATPAKLAEIKASPEVLLITQSANPSSDAAPEPGQRILVVEAILGRNSRLIGKTIRQSDIRRRHGVRIAAIHRQGANLTSNYEDLRMSMGDVLLLEGPADNIASMQREEEFLNLAEVRLPTASRARAILSSSILAILVLAAACGLVPIATAAIVGAVAVVALRCLDLQQAYRAIDWNVIFLIHGMLGIGMAIEKSGAAAFAANHIVTWLQGQPPWLLLAAFYLLTSILTELVTNNAVAILLTPIAIAVAERMGIDPRPLIVAVMFGASASFVTPIGYQTNTYVYAAGNYRFTDFVRIGLPLNVLLWIAATLLIPYFWPF